MDIRLLFAEEVAEQMGAIVLPEKCGALIGYGNTCRFPMLMRPEQGLQFCWFCVCDRELSHRGRTALTKAKLAAKGIIICDEMHPHPMADDSRPDGEQDRSSWDDGMPL